MQELFARKLRALERSDSGSLGSPVFAVNGQRTSRGEAERTRWFQYVSALQFKETDQQDFLRAKREKTHTRMTPRSTDTGCRTTGSIT